MAFRSLSDLNLPLDLQEGRIHNPLWMELITLGYLLLLPSNPTHMPIPR
jgi:hypothetical protein